MNGVQPFSRFGRAVSMKPLLLAFLIFAFGFTLVENGSFVLAQALQHPSSSIQGETVPRDDSLKNAHVKNLPLKDSPQPLHDYGTKPSRYGTAPRSPKVLVRNADPVVVVDSAPTDVDGLSKIKSNNKAPESSRAETLRSVERVQRMGTIITVSGTNPPLERNRSRVSFDEEEDYQYDDTNDFVTDDFQSNNFDGEKEIPPQQTIRPIEDTGEHDHEHHEDDGFHYQSAMFLGVMPGKSTDKEVIEKLGSPQKMTKVGLKTAHLYSIDELNHIEILFENNVVHSIEVVFHEAYPVDQVREILATELQKARPVSFADEHGDVIGLMFPEKGLTLIYTPSEEPGVPSALVKKIAILPIMSEPFVIRAKGYLDESPTLSKKDLKAAIYYDSDNAESHALLAQIELLGGDGASAMEYIQRAISLEPTLPQYHITLTKALILMNRIEDAKVYLKEVLFLCEKYQHQKAVALCLLGDLYRMGSKIDCEQAYEYHKQAMDLAIALRDYSNPVVRGVAREVLIDSQLGVVKDIAHGNWDNKWSAIEKWFASVKEVIKDPEVTSKKVLVREYLFRVACCGLSAQAVLSEHSKIEPYIQDVLVATEELLNVSDDALRKKKVLWESGCSLFEAIQSYQRRKQYSAALKHGETTVDYMEHGIEGRTSESDYYLLSRLYFRLGAIHAIGMKNHRAAVVWFDRTLPVFDDILPGLGPEESGRVGEMLVSMGVSFWETDQKSDAIRLSELGLKRIKNAVDQGALDMSSLLIPYSNLSTMYGKMDDPDKADRYYQAATKIQQSIAEKNNTNRNR